MTDLTIEQRRAIAIATARAKAKDPGGAGPQAQPEPGFFSMRADSDTPERNKNYSGSVLPLSTDAEGNARFDSDAGVLGVVKRAVQLPKQVVEGEIDPTSEEGAQRTLEAGMVMSPMGAAARAVPKGLMGNSEAYRDVPKVAPTRAELKAATDAGYAEARSLGAEYTPKSVSDWATRVADELDQGGQIAPNYPEVHALLDKLKNPPDGASSIRLEAIDALYKELGKLGGSADAGKASVAALVQRQLDDYFDELDASDIVAGTVDPQRAANVLKESRGNAAASFRSDRVTGLEQTSERRTAAANSGRNADNNIRQRLTSLIESNKGSRGLSEGEKEAIDDIIYGRPLKNAYRYIGNLLGGGGGLGSAVLGGAAGVGGATALGPMGAALSVVPPVIGAGSRSLANRMSKQELRMLDELMRSRSPLADAAPVPMPVYQPGAAQGGAEAMTRALVPSHLPVYQPQPKQAPAPLRGGMSQEIMRALLADPNGA